MIISKKTQFYFISLLVVASSFGSSLIGLDLGFAKLSPYRVLGLVLSAALLFIAGKCLLFGKGIKKDWVVALFLWWLAAALLSFLWVPDKAAWFRAVFFLWVGFASLLGIYAFVMDRADFDKVLNVFVIVAVLINVLAWYELLTGSTLLMRANFEGNIQKNLIQKLPVLWFANPNNLAFYNMLALFVVYTRQQTSRRFFVKAFLGLVMVSIFTLLIQSRSRGAMLGIFVGFFVVIVFYIYQIIRGRKRVLPLIGFLLLSAFLIPIPRMVLHKVNYPKSATQQQEYLMQVMGSNMKGILSSITEGAGIGLGPVAGDAQDMASASDDLLDEARNPALADSASAAAVLMESDSIRVSLILNGLEILKRTRFLGTGAGNLEHWMAGLDLPEYTNGITNMHNFWAEALVDYGIQVFIPMLIGFVALGIAFLLHAVRRKALLDQSLAAGMVAMMGAFILGSISPSSIISFEQFWPFVGLVLAANKVLKKARLEENLPLPERVVFLSTLDLWSMNEGQGAPSFYNTVKFYIDSGWEVTLVKPTGKNRKWYKLSGYEQVGFVNTWLESLFKYRKIGAVARYLSAKYYTCQFIKLGGDALERKNGLVYAYEVHGVKAARQLSILYNLPFVTRFQGTIMVDHPDTFINRLRYYPHIQALRQKSDTVIMTNDGTFGDRVLHDVGNKSRVVHYWRNGVERFEKNGDGGSLRAKLGIGRDATVLLTVSRVVGWKRLDRSIRAFAAVLPLHPQARLVIAGDGSALAQNQALAKELKVEDKVFFVGSVPHDDLYAYYDMADIFLSLYDIGNVGNPSMEAMLMGKSILTINNGDTKSLMGDSERGLMLESTDQELINRGLDTLLSDAALAKQYGDAAKAYADQHFWTWEERMTTELREVSNLLRRGKATYE